MQTVRTFQKLSGFSAFFGARNLEFSTSQIVLGTTPQQFKLKQDEDRRKSLLAAKYIKLANGAIRASGGETDPKNNKELAQIIEQGVKEGVARKSLMNSIAQKDLSSSTTYLLTHGGMAALFECRASSQAHGKNQIVYRLKKSMFQGAITDTREIENFFKRKGIVTINHPVIDGKKLNEDESTELAIEVDAEEVVIEDENLKFLCDPASLKDVVAALEDKDLEVKYSSIEYIPVEKIDAEEDDKEFYELFLKLCKKKETPAERKCDILEIVNNFE